jgi:flagellar basal body rod protein FlgC
MDRTTPIALSGIAAAGLRLDSAAHNVANTLTPRFMRQQVVLQAQPDGGVAASTARAHTPGTDLATDLVDQRLALVAFKANLHAIKVQDAIVGSLLDIRA